MTKFICWNVNGIRAWYKKGALGELLKEKPDVFCFQETKAHEDQIPDELKNVPGYKAFFDHSKGKKGYSGVAIYLNEKVSKIKSHLRLMANRTLGRLRFTCHLPTGYTRFNIFYIFPACV